jgi:hypothetical protein
MLMLVFAVLATIKLDRKAQLGTIEIEHVGTGGMLPPKAQPVQPAAPKLAPQSRFNIGCSLTKLAGALRFFFGAIEFGERRDPHPARFARRPPPCRGR